MARFTKVFQLITVVLVIAVVNVYVMGAPIKVVTEPGKTDKPDTTETKAAPVVTEVVSTTVAPASLAAEKLPLAPGSKINFNRIFSKSEISSRAASSHTFLNAKVAGKDVFKAPPRTGVAPADDTPGDDGNNNSKGAWIAVGVIAAVLTIAVIGLRNDRGIESVQQ